ncbi:CCA tRNA nucleotidyltransferase [Roseburia sp. 499]|uniref:CCA tRNA nucleotidyltransferase n=1 Tax=Roseburia sp. 499 TaxID=1261634 RepID=UPI0009513F7A|nr:CCA tRNA nucleotidyltransferase [Roseburia sp. 499]WVK69404.1 CCA tRNA nucleotidyltransferase [Roseburia sp. 499]
MVIQLPEKVKYIIDTLMEAGYEAYAVGGCIRDSILGRKPGDWDITTSAKPMQVKELFSRTIDTGIQHGTVTVMMNGEGFEVTTYRVDGEYEDGRHPKEVVFTASLLEDLKRRDFTINAMAYNEKDGLVDAFSGIEDLEKKVIRCVGNPKERFEEDALRMMRAVRFAAQLGFSIEEETKGAITELAQNLAKVSAERIQVELVKLLVSNHPEEFLTFYETGLTRIFLPEFDAMIDTPQNNKHHCYNVGQHTIEAVKNSPPDKIIRLTMLLHDVAKPVCKSMDEQGIYHFYGHPAKGSEMAKEILKRLKFDNDTMRRVTTLIKWHDDTPPLEPRAIRRAISRIGLEQYPALFAVKRADTMGKNQYQRAEKLAYIEGYQKLYEEILEKQQCLTLKDLAVTGKDLIEAGMKPGKELGEVLERMLDYVLEHPEENQKEILMKQIKI